MIRVGINGFGRIGRAIFRIARSERLLSIVGINDIDPNIHNLAYLLKYDSTYGRLKEKVDVRGKTLCVEKSKSSVYSFDRIDKVPWEQLGVDVVIDSSGVKENVIAARKIANKSVKKVIVTHSPKNLVDKTVIHAVNEEEYDAGEHHVVSSSICDANAIAPLLKILDSNIGIEAGFITTLHPWLSYQNLLDGPISSVASPGHYWNDFALGRSSVGSLIPKPTTVVQAVAEVLPNMRSKLHAMSFRVPTSIVASSDSVIVLAEKITKDDVIKMIKKHQARYPRSLLLDDRSLVSLDYLGTDYAAIIDKRWLKVFRGNIVKSVLWYDNEWGYAKRVIDLVHYIMKTPS